MTGNRCIWCKQVSNHSYIEDVIPDVLGCLADFVLTSDDVCQSCDNKLGHLDQAVANDFDIISFAAGIPRKKVKPPAIKSRGNFYAFHPLQGPQWHFNMGSNSASANDGTIVALFRGGDRNIKAKSRRHGPLAEISFETKFGHSEKFRRGLYKIAFSALAHHLGGKE